jgi:quinoprotein glucose dehydrogenase
MIQSRNFIALGVLAVFVVGAGWLLMDRSKSPSLVPLSFGIHADIAEGEWPDVGGNVHGAKYSPLGDISPANVASLQIAWTYRTGEADEDTRRQPRLAATPIVVDGVMYVGTPLGRIIALDPETGEELWVFDAEVDPDRSYGDFTNRGVATWLDTEALSDAACRRRLYIGTIDARLIAVDGLTGEQCSSFGRRGQIDLRRGLRIDPFEYEAYQLTSPPLVIGDLVITGSAITDNSRINPASGEVRAWDARTGRLQWSWDAIPQATSDLASETWAPGSASQTGAANVWSSMTADPERGMIFLPTSSPAPDYFGGLRHGMNRHANSIVALNAGTGEVIWSFQTVHHDLWDYDNPAAPALINLMRDGQEIPAVLAVAKTGQLFVLHRETGEPIFPVEERKVPASDVPGESAWPTQPFTRGIEPLSPQQFSLQDIWGPTEEDRAACLADIAELRNEGVFTPPSLQGTLVLPSNIGGAHWGGLAVDAERQLAVVPVNRHVSMVQLIPAEGFSRAAAEQESDEQRLGYEYNVMRGTPYAMRRRALRSPSGFPCSPPPFGTLVAVDLRTGQRAWEVPLGSMELLIPAAAELGGDTLGATNLGGPMITASGLVFVAATPDNLIRAFDSDSGEELWRGELPASGRATPMSFRGRHTGRQFVVIAAGGGGLSIDGDHIVAFSLSDEGSL